jgi:hypothetical protein
MRGRPLGRHAKPTKGSRGARSAITRPRGLSVRGVGIFVLVAVAGALTVGALGLTLGLGPSTWPRGPLSDVQDESKGAFVRTAPLETKQANGTVYEDQVHAEYRKPAVTGLCAEEVEALLGTLEDLDVGVRRQALYSPHWKHSRDWTEPDARLQVRLVRLVEDPDARIRWRAARLLSDTYPSHPGTLRAVQAFLDSPDREERMVGCLSLWSLGAHAKSVVPAVLRLLDEAGPASSERMTVLIALGKIGAGDDLVRDALLRATTSDEWGIRAAAAQALGDLGQVDRELEEAVRRLMRDPNSSVKREAHSTADKLGVGLRHRTRRAGPRRR